MKKKRSSVEQIVAVLKQVELGVPVGEYAVPLQDVQRHSKL